MMQDDRLAKLTEEGQHVRMLIERQERQPFTSSASAGPVVIRGESETTESRRAYEELAPEDLDLALDSELQRLEQQEVHAGHQ